MFWDPITPNETVSVVSTLRNNKSLGPDNTGLKLPNLSLTSGCFPQSLNTAKVISLYKKGDKCNPGNYRPISLLNIFDNLLEKTNVQTFVLLLVPA